MVKKLQSPHDDEKNNLLITGKHPKNPTGVVSEDTVNQVAGGASFQVSADELLLTNPVSLTQQPGPCGFIKHEPSERRNLLPKQTGLPSCSSKDEQETAADTVSWVTHADSEDSRNADLASKLKNSDNVKSNLLSTTKETKIPTPSIFETSVNQVADVPRSQVSANEAPHKNPVSPSQTEFSGSFTSFEQTQKKSVSFSQPSSQPGPSGTAKVLAPPYKNPTLHWQPPPNNGSMQSPQTDTMSPQHKTKDLPRKRSSSIVQPETSQSYSGLEQDTTTHLEYTEAKRIKRSDDNTKPDAWDATTQSAMNTSADTPEEDGNASAGDFQGDRAPSAGVGEQTENTGARSSQPYGNIGAGTGQLIGNNSADAAQDGYYDPPHPILVIVEDDDMNEEDDIPDDVIDNEFVSVYTHGGQHDDNNEENDEDQYDWPN